MVNKKLFTLEEVNQLLPRLSAEVIQLQQLKREFRIHHRKLQQKKAAISGSISVAEDPYFELETTLEFLNIQQRGIIRRIQETGAQLKDIELGLIDFPGELNGEPIFYCWQLGEEKVTHWHHIWEGYSYRKSLPIHK